MPCQPECMCCERVIAHDVTLQTTHVFWHKIPLSGCTKSRSDQLIDGVLLVGIRHDDSVVLGTHVGLHALAIGGASGENVTACVIST